MPNPRICVISDGANLNEASLALLKKHNIDWINDARNIDARFDSTQYDHVILLMAKSNHDAWVWFEEADGTFHAQRKLAQRLYKEKKLKLAFMARDKGADAILNINFLNNCKNAQRALGKFDVKDIGIIINFEEQMRLNGAIAVPAALSKLTNTDKPQQQRPEWPKHLISLIILNFLITVYVALTMSLTTAILTSLLMSIVNLGLGFLLQRTFQNDGLEVPRIPVHVAQREEQAPVREAHGRAFHQRFDHQRNPQPENREDRNVVPAPLRKRR